MMLKGHILSRSGFFYSFIFAALYVYIFKVIQPELHYHFQQTPFLADHLFFMEFVKYPGGLMEYLAGFLSQFFYYGWLGSFIILLTAFSFVFLTYRLLSNYFSNPTLNVLHFIPLVLMTGLFNNYNLPFASILAVLFTYLTILFFLNLKNKGLSIFLLFIFFGLAVYYVAGSGSYMVFAISIILIILFQSGMKKTAGFILFIIALSCVIPYLGFKYLFNITLKTAYLSFIPDLPGILEYKPNIVFRLFIYSFPILVILSVLIDKIRKMFADSENENKESETVLHPDESEIETAQIPEKKYKHTGLYFNLIIIAILSFYVLYKGRNSSLKNIILVDYYTYSENWKKAEEIALSEKNYNVIINFNYNRAIDHQGKLTTNFFHYPQRFGPDILNPNKITGSDFAMISSDYYYDLGYMSEALHWAHEAQSLQMFSPRVLKRMVMVNLVIANYKTAEKYLDILDRNFINKKFVAEFRPFVEDTLSIHNNKEIMSKRSFSPEGYVVSGVEENCRNLLMQNSDNKRAFEHLMLYYLMDHQLNKFFEYINDGRKFYKDSPLIYEEALTVFVMEKNQRNIRNLNTGAKAKETAMHFMNVMKQHNNNAKDAQNQMYKIIGNSYIYYLTYYFPEVKRSRGNM